MKKESKCEMVLGEWSKEMCFIEVVCLMLLEEKTTCEGLWCEWNSEWGTSESEWLQWLEWEHGV